MCIRDRRARQRRALAHASRQLARRVRQERAQPALFQQVHGPRLAARIAPALDLGAQHDVVEEMCIRDRMYLVVYRIEAAVARRYG